MDRIEELYRITGLSESSSDNSADLPSCFDLGDLLFHEERFEEARTVYVKALAIEEGSAPGRHEKRKAAALRNLGEIFVQKGSLSEGLEKLKHSCRVFQELGDNRNVCALLNMIGIVHKRRDEFLECLKAYDAGLKLAEENGFSELQAKFLYNTGNLFIVFRSLENEAMEYFSRAEKAYLKLQDKRGLGYVLSAKAQLHSNAGRMEECLELSRRSLQLRQEAGTDFEIGFSLRNLGGHLDSEKDTGEKKSILHRALRIGEETGLKSLRAETMVLFCIFHLDLNQLDKAESCLNDVFDLISDSEGFNYLRTDALDCMIRLSTEKKDWDKALAGFESKRELNDLLGRESTAREIKAVMAEKEMEFLRRQIGFLTEKKNELSMINRRLRDSLARVKRLRGLLPVCTACGRVRDDEGYWKKIDEYLEEQVGLKLSHSLCEVCRGSIYPELDHGEKGGTLNET